jgi:7-carboxy-7-deazaguanine synthase
LVQALPQEIPVHKVLLMPEGISQEEISPKINPIIDLCRTNGYRYCSRLHIDLFGNRRGT